MRDNKLFTAYMTVLIILIVLTAQLEVYGAEKQGRRPLRPSASDKGACTQSAVPAALADYFSHNGVIELAGKIRGDIPVHMQLQPVDKGYITSVNNLYYNSSLTMTGADIVQGFEGYYYYDKYLKSIRVEAVLYTNGYICIREFNDKDRFNGSFGGFLFHDQTIKGMWSGREGNPLYQFCLAKAGTKLSSISPVFDVRKIGNYWREGSTGGYSSCLTVNTVGEGKFKFHISGYSSPNTGDIGGVAMFTDISRRTAVFYNKEDNLTITFEFYGDMVKVSGNEVLNHYCGMHVPMDGVYKKS